MENNNIVYGKNAVVELLKAKKRNINKIFIAKNLHYDTKINQIFDLARENNPLLNTRIFMILLKIINKK